MSHLVVSVAPFIAFSTAREGREYLMPPAPHGGYSVLEIEDTPSTIYLGNGRNFDRNITAVERAADLVFQIEHFGVFVPNGAEPTEAELAKARGKLEAYFKTVMEMADSEWKRSGDRRQLPSHAFPAAEYFNVKRDWMVEISPTGDCPGCGGKVKPSIARCPECRWIFDWPKARLGGLLTPDETRLGVRKGLIAEDDGLAGPGRPTNKEQAAL